MDRKTTNRQQLLEAVNTLPDEVLIELAGFLDYLRYKATRQRDLTTHSPSFLLAVADLGNSGQQDVSERDEEILRNEIDPVSGWNLKPSNPA